MKKVLILIFIQICFSACQNNTVASDDFLNRWDNKVVERAKECCTDFDSSLMKPTIRRMYLKKGDLSFFKTKIFPAGDFIFIEHYFTQDKYEGSFGILTTDNSYKEYLYDKETNEVIENEKVKKYDFNWQELNKYLNDIESENCCKKGEVHDSLIIYSKISSKDNDLIIDKLIML